MTSEKIETPFLRPAPPPPPPPPPPHELVNVGCKISAVLLSPEYIESKILFPGIRHIAWWRLLGLFSWYLFMLSSVCNSLNDRATVDEIYRRRIFTWIGQQWPPQWLAIAPLIIIIVYNVKLHWGMWIRRSHDCDKKCQQSVFKIQSIYITFHIVSFHFELKKYFTIKIWFDNPRLICDMNCWQIKCLHHKGSGDKSLFTPR